MQHFRTIFAAGAALALALSAGSEPVASIFASPSESVEGEELSDTRRTYGKPVAVGEGRARTYIVRDPGKRNVPVEIGVALEERALEGLPALGTGQHTGHGEMHEFILPLPAGHGTQYQFVEMNWNAAGHLPSGVYDSPHFDFHFYIIPKAERDAIVRSDPEFVAKGNNLPVGDLVPPFTVPAVPPGMTPGEDAVPRMGVHWIDVRTPELQGVLGNPEAYKPFTTTFIIGSWDGRFIFWEPMITRAHILEKKSTSDSAVRDEIISIPTAARYERAGWYPTAYRIAWDARAKEYRIALTNLVRRE